MRILDSGFSREREILEPEIHLGEKDHTLFIRPYGHMTANFCSDLRSRTSQRISREDSPERIVVDLSQCTYMDSTFMGLLVGLNKKLGQLNKDKLVVYRPTKEAADLLDGLGLKGYLTFDWDTPWVFPQEMETISGKTRATADFILKAHEHLMDLSRENRDKFSSLRSVLKKQIHSDKDDPSP